MSKLSLLTAVLVLFVTGCHRSRTSDIRFTLAPVGDSVTATCVASSSGKCHFAFAGQSTPAADIVDVGSTITFSDIAPGTDYCAETHKVSFDTCKKSPIPLTKQSTEKSSSDGNPRTN